MNCTKGPGPKRAGARSPPLYLLSEGEPLLDAKHIRNFCIIAHIDHGKSTLADRILEKTKAVDERTMEAQILDDMELERERGITIKARAVTMHYTAQNGEEYEFNLIDTPGHVDFGYEVSRSLAACEGAVLVVDASQGVEAQTLANTYLALEHDLELVPILNKIDLPSAEPERVAKEVEDVIGLPCMDAPRVSAKMGIGIEDVLERVVSDIPAPKGEENAPLKALIFDAVYDSYKGVVVYLRVFDGAMRVGDTVKLMATGAEFQLVEVGHMGATALAPCGELKAGEVGYFTASIKTLADTRVGDTVTLKGNPTPEALPGYRRAVPMVFCGIYPADGAKYPDLKEALEKLQLNDASLSFDPETSVALGFGFRCGFLGLLHLEIIIERLEREFDLDLITTAPSVEYRITLTDGTQLTIDNPTNYPDPAKIAKCEEPFVDAHIYTPTEYVGSLMELCQGRRGVMRDMKYLDAARVDLHYELPLGEIVYDFFDAIKSRSRGYASYDYEMKGFVESKLVKLDILLNGDMVDALSMIVHADTAYAKGRRLAEKLKENIPRQMFEIPIQAAIGGKIIARETVKAMRKDVLAKCYGGDITRKKKLLEKQKEGKKKMRQLGTVSVPSEAFTAVLKLDE
ncbi:MAG: translation elongation factor 4 [Ruthenibacterium sp.]|nr:translation elongation factor 4 [Oscillospiraceae bacterium]